MAKFIRGVGAAAALTGVSLVSGPAFAAHLFVSVFGNDGGDGSAAAPFRHLQAAINAAASGDVIQLETGGNFGPGTITNKTLTILSTNDGGIIEPGGPGIVFNDPGGDDVLTLNGILIDQGGSANNGVVFNSGEKLNVVDTVIQNGSGNASGIVFQPTTNAEINILDSIVSEFGTVSPSAGVRISPRGDVSIKGLFDDVLLRNTRVGVTSTVAGTQVIGITLDDVDFTGGGVGIQSSGANSAVRLRDAVISNNTTGLLRLNSGKIISLGGNSVRGNTANGTFSGIEAQQ